MKQDKHAEEKEYKHNTEVSALIGSFGLVNHNLKIFMKLFIPTHQLIHKHSPKAHPQNMLPRI